MLSSLQYAKWGVSRYKFFQSRLFTCLSAAVDESSELFKLSHSRMQDTVSQFQEVSTEFKEGGGTRSQLSHVNRNKKVLPRDRLSMLFDGGKYLEMSRLAGYGQSYGNIPQAGVITAFGQISGRLCVALVNDATVKGGTLFPISVTKNLRFQEIIQQNKIPCIFVVDSGGAFLPLQADIFPGANHGGRAFYNEAFLQTMRIPQLAIVLGSCTAGGAYVPTMCEEFGMVDGIGHVFLGGPPLVKAATGEEIGADELGGAWMHSTVSGCSDHFFPTESEGFSTLRHIVSTLPEQSDSTVNRTTSADPIYPSLQLRGLGLNFPDTPPSRDEQRMRGYQILARVFDGSTFLEFKKEYGSSLIAGFARLNGRMVAVLLSLGGLARAEAEKGAHLAELAQVRGLPLIFLTHTSDSSPQSSSDGPVADTEGDIIRAKSKFLASVATIRSIKITVVIGDASGWDYYMMGAKCMSPHFLFAWPSARFGLLDETNKVPPFTALQAAGNMWIDDVILPEDTRQILSSVLDIASFKTKLSDIEIPVKPVLRM